MRPCLRKLLVLRPARLGPSRGSWVCVDEDGPCWAPFEPRRRPQVGKSGDPHSQNADSSPRAQGAPGLGRAERRKGKREASWALTACGLGHRVEIDWTWAALFPHAPLILRHARRTRSRTQPLPFLLLERPLSFLLSNSSFCFQPNLEPSPLPIPMAPTKKGRGKKPVPLPCPPPLAAPAEGLGKVSSALATIAESP